MGIGELSWLSAGSLRTSRKAVQSGYTLYLRARAQFYRFNEEGFREAITLLGQALAIDPSYAPAAALVSWCRWFGLTLGWGVLSDSDISTTCRQVGGGFESCNLGMRTPGAYLPLG
jgi:hypothetical protein